MGSLIISILLFLGLVFSQEIPVITGSDVSNGLDGDDIDIVDIQKVKDDIVKLSWSLRNTDDENNNNNTNHSTFISGWVVSYQILVNQNITQNPSEKQNASSSSTTDLSDEGLEFRSAELPADVRTLSLHLPCYCEIRICVYAVDNQTRGQSLSLNVKRTCSDLMNSQDGKKVDSGKEEISDTKKLIVGMSAGCVFLIPCIFVLIIIMRKDKQMRMATIYEELGKEHFNPAMDFGDEEVKVLTKGDRDGERNERGMGSGAGGVEWKSLSVDHLKGVKGPTIYIHTGDDASVSGEYYSERL